LAEQRQDKLRPGRSARTARGGANMLVNRRSSPNDTTRPRQIQDNTKTKAYQDEQMKKTDKTNTHIKAKTKTKTTKQDEDTTRAKTHEDQIQDQEVRNKSKTNLTLIPTRQGHDATTNHQAKATKNKQKHQKQVVCLYQY
jgi:hypothetical protein